MCVSSEGMDDTVLRFFFFSEQTMRVIMSNEANNLLWFGRLKTYLDFQTWLILRVSFETLFFFFVFFFSLFIIGVSVRSSEMSSTQITHNKQVKDCKLSI